MSVKVDSLGKDAIINAAKTSMSSKLLNAESDFFAKLVVDAMLKIETKNHLGEKKYPISFITANIRQDKQRTNVHHVVHLD